MASEYRERERKTDRHVGGLKDSQAGRHTDKQTDRQAWAGRHRPTADRQPGVRGYGRVHERTHFDNVTFLIEITRGI